MAFYIQPPVGNISLLNLTKFSKARLELLFFIMENIHTDVRTTVSSLLSESQNVFRSDCLIEGTTKDGISHFILRFAKLAIFQILSTFIY